MKEILLKGGGVALVDDEDYDFLSQWVWRANSTGYVCRSEKINGKLCAILMHRIIMNTPTGLVVDHINHNKLDNRKSNLRNCTTSENGKNHLFTYLYNNPGAEKLLPVRESHVDINDLIHKYNMANPKNKTNQRKLARELAELDIYTEHSARAMIQRHQSGQTKSIDFALLQFLCTKFGVKPNDIIK